MDLLVIFAISCFLGFIASVIAYISIHYYEKESNNKKTGLLVSSIIIGTIIFFYFYHSIVNSENFYNNIINLNSIDAIKDEIEKYYDK